MSGAREPRRDRTVGERCRVLVVYDPSQAGVTSSVRGFHFREPLAARGWTLEFLEYAPGASRPSRRPWRECALALRARSFDLVYLLKVPSLSLVRRLKAMAGVPVVFDLTDSLWRTTVGGEVWGDLDAILTESDAVFTCNTYDTDHARRLNPQTVCLSPYADVEAFQHASRQRPARTDPAPRVGWIGSASTVRAIENVAEALDRAAEAIPGLTLRVVGARGEGDLPAFRRLRVSMGPASYDQRTMIDEILDMDVGIYPLVLDEEDYCVRGPLKALNYMAGGVACVCHRAGDVARIVEDGRNGMLAASVEEWRSRIEALMRDPARRRDIGAAGIATVRASFSFEIAVDALEAAFSEVSRGRRRKPALAASMGIMDQLLRAAAETVRSAVARDGPGR